MDCGQRESDAYKAVSPKLVLEVLSPSTGAFDISAKLAESKAVEGIDHTLHVDPDAPSVAHWTRDEARAWTRQDYLGLEASIGLPSLGIALALDDVYDGVVFPPPLRSS